MTAATPMPMLHVPLKTTDEVDWAPPLRAYIETTYADDPAKYREEMQTLYKLRQDVRGVGSDAMGRDLLLKYYGQLELLDLRFPVDELHVNVVFTWYDCFTGKPTSQHSIAYEKACVIFNIGAALAHMATSAPRIDVEGIKRAYHHFQIAAGIFQFINDNFLHAPSVDLSRDVVKTLGSLMLAQAQEVFLEKTLADKKRGSIIVKLVAALASMYSGLHDLLIGNDSFKTYFDTNRYFHSMIHTKAKYFVALAQYQRALQCEIDSKYGECICRLTLAEKEAKEAYKLAVSFNNNFKNSTTVTEADAGSVMLENSKTLQANVIEQKAKAIKDNDIVYHQPVPNVDALPPLEKLIAPKALGFADIFPGGAYDLQRIVGGDIFIKLVPLAVHEKSSMYSEEKAKVLRKQAEQIETINAQVVSSLESLGLPSALEKFKNNTSESTQRAEPSREVLDAAAQVIQDEAGSSTEELMSTLEGLRARVKEMLDDLTLQLDKDHHECETQRIKFESLWTQTTAATVDQSLRNSIRSHRQAYDQAGTSDTGLMIKYRDIHADIDILKGDLVQRYAEVAAAATSVLSQSTLPQSASQNQSASLLDLDTSTAELPLVVVVQRLSKIIAALHKLKSERQALHVELKEMVHADDISDLLVLNKKANTDKHLFEAELQKFSPLIDKITANINVTKQYLAEVSRTWVAIQSHSEASSIRTQSAAIETKTSELTRKVMSTKQQLFQVKAGLRTGIEFYSDLSDLVESTKRSVHNYVNERSDERQRLLVSLENTRADREQRMLREQLAKLQVGSGPTLATTMPQNIDRIYSPNHVSPVPIQSQHTGYYTNAPTPTQSQQHYSYNTSQLTSASAPNFPPLPLKPPSMMNVPSTIQYTLPSPSSSGPALPYSLPVQSSYTGAPVYHNAPTYDTSSPTSHQRPSTTHNGSAYLSYAPPQQQQYPPQQYQQPQQPQQQYHAAPVTDHYQPQMAYGLSGAQTPQYSAHAPLSTHRGPNTIQTAPSPYGAQPSWQPQQSQPLYYQGQPQPYYQPQQPMYTQPPSGLTTHSQPPGSMAHPQQPPYGAPYNQTHQPPPSPAVQPSFSLLD